MVADADGEGRGEIETDEEKEVDASRPEPEAEQPADVKRDDKETMSPVDTSQRTRQGARYGTCRLSGDEIERVFF